MAPNILSDFLPHFSYCRPYGNSLPYSIIASLSLVNASHGEQYEIGVLVSLIGRKVTPYLVRWSFLRNKINHNSISFPK